MANSEGLEKESFGKVRLKDPKVSSKGHIKLETSDLRMYQSMLGLEDLIHIWILHGVLGEFDLELPSPDAR